MTDVFDRHVQNRFNKAFKLARKAKELLAFANDDKTLKSYENQPYNARFYAWTSVVDAYESLVGVLDCYRAYVEDYKEVQQ